MVTQARIKSLAARIHGIATAVDPNAGAVRVVVFDGETPEEAMRRHVELRPEHRGRRVIIDRAKYPRNEVHEMSAVFAGATEADYRAFKAEFDRTFGVPSSGRSFLDFYDEA